jgi:hypothetical protein
VVKEEKKEQAPSSKPMAIPTSTPFPIANSIKNGGLTDVYLPPEKRSPQNQGLLSYWEKMGNSMIGEIDDVFNKQIDESGRSHVVKNYEEAYPTLGSALKGKKNQ